DQAVLADLADVTFNRYLTSGRVQALYDSVTTMVKELLATNPNSVVGLRLEASLFYGDGKLEQAIATYRKANALQPFDPAIVLPLAEALHTNNKSPEAESLAMGLVAHTPSFAPVYDWLSGVYISSGRVAEAEKILKARIESNPKNFQAILVLGGFYRNQHKDREAKSLLEAATARSTDIPNRYALAGDFYTFAKDWANAENCYRTGMTAEPRAKPDYLTRLATIYVLQKRNADAMTSLDEAVKEQPDNWRAQGMRISLMVDSGKPEQIDQAIALAKALAQKRPSDGRFPALLARGYTWKGDTQLAASYYQLAARLDRQFLEPRIALAQISKEKRDFSGIFRYTEQVLEVAPQDMQARLLHAWGWMGEGLFADADNEMQSLLRDFPDSDDVKLQAGLLYLTEKKTRASIAVFEKLLLSRPGDQRILAALATAYVQQGSPDAAIQLIVREVQKDPASDSKRQLLANLAEKLGRFDLALQQFKALSEAHPEVSEYHFEIGKLYEFAGDKANAVRSFEAAQRLAPQDATKEGRLALSYYSAGLMDQADAAYARSVALNPNDPVLLNNRAYFLAETGKNPDEALHLVQSALLKIPDNPALLDTLAFSYIKKKSVDNARTILNRLVHDYPDEPMFRYHLAMALAQRGDRAAAIKELEASLTKHPSKEDQIKIRDLLSKLG
ncbi:MAG: Tetratricopeptide 2 repeat protein, partial [Bryobacterales bacterium]|nr:Tetratricopeptide 2 repeat protein [Bryobacterales bacterium]